MGVISLLGVVEMPGMEVDSVCVCVCACAMLGVQRAIARCTKFSLRQYQKVNEVRAVPITIQGIIYLFPSHFLMCVQGSVTEAIWQMMMSLL